MVGPIATYLTTMPFLTYACGYLYLILFPRSGSPAAGHYHHFIEGEGGADRRPTGGEGADGRLAKYDHRQLNHIYEMLGLSKRVCFQEQPIDPSSCMVFSILEGKIKDLQEAVRGKEETQVSATDVD